MRFEANVRTHSIMLFGGSLLAAMLIGSAIARVGIDLHQARRMSQPTMRVAQPAPTARPSRASTVVLGAVETDEITAPAEMGVRSELSRSVDSAAQSGEVAPARSAPPAFERIIDETFDAPSGEWPTRDEPTWRSTVADGSYRIELAGRASLNFFRALPAERCRISVDVAVHSGGAGLVFLLGQPNTLYRVLLGADGSYTLQRQRGNDVVALIDWTTSDLLRPDPHATYQLTVERQGGDVTILIDGRPLTTWAIPDGPTTPQYGLAIASRHGSGAASFDNLVVDVPIAP